MPRTLPYERYEAVRCLLRELGISIEFFLECPVFTGRSPDEQDNHEERRND